MIDIQYNIEQHNVCDRNGVTYGKFNTYKTILKYDPISDANFIELCEKNEDGTYHIVVKINQYAEWIQLCPAFGMWLNVQTTDNLIDDDLVFVETMVADFPEVVIEEM